MGIVGGGVDSCIEVVWSVLTEGHTRLGTPAGERAPFTMYMGIFEGWRRYKPTRYPALHSKAAVARHTALALKLVVKHHTEGIGAFVHVRELLQNLTNFADAMQANGLGPRGPRNA